MTEAAGRDGLSGLIELTMTGTYAGYDIGSVLPGRLGDYAWLDENGNGLQDTDEHGIAGIKVELLRGGAVTNTAVTDQYGFWVMDDVYPAVYTLRVTMPDEVTITKRVDGLDGINSVLADEDGDYALADGLQVISDRRKYDADLGFVLRVDGVYPAGYGVFDKQIWTR